MKRRLLVLVSLIVFALDQLTKLLVIWAIPEGDSIPILPGIFDLVHTRNPGAAFGSFASLPESIRLPFFYLTSTIAVVIILLYYRHLQNERRLVYGNLALILGGALGNIFDRIFRSEVVDFLSFHWHHQWAQLQWGSFHLRFKLEWPAFNLADAAISVGVFWLIILMSQKPRKG